MQKALIDNYEEYLNGLLGEISMRKASGKKALYRFNQLMTSEVAESLKKFFSENMPDYTLEITSCGVGDSKMRDVVILFPKK